MSKAQRQALEDIQKHGDPWMRVRGQSQHGGWHSVMRVIQGKRWARRSARGWALTVAGAKALAAESSKGIRSVKRMLKEVL